MSDHAGRGPNHYADPSELPTVDAATGRSPDAGGFPSRIGPYVIKRRIASGGMGTIYEGMQEQPRRPVAVKVMKHGVTSREALRRFQYEAQLLARLHHPGIAQVYEAGTHDDGTGPVPYFVMEYIPNAKFITAYADEKKLDLRARLELFAKVCDAVHHGHQKGVIHRDLKPSNILVDSTGMPRIIDFGVARATDSDMALATVQTEVGQLVGSLQYMSPEQFEADPHDIDTRSDVYALGVVLYELLGGQLPYDVSTTTVFEAAKMVREKEPPRLGARRHELRGEVETIVHKALVKDRDQRYQSAYGLAQDIRRYLAGEAIAARPPSLTYQFRVFARRNRALLGAVAAVFVVLVGASIVSTSLYLRAESQRRLAERQTEKAQAAERFMRSMLETAVPEGFGAEPRIVDLLDTTRREAGATFRNDPEVEAEIRRSLGYGYVNLSRWQDAEQEWTRAVELRRKVYGGNDPRTIESLQDLSIIPEVMGRKEDLVRIRKEIVAGQTATYGATDPRTLESLSSLAEDELTAGRLSEAEASARKAVEGYSVAKGPEDVTTLGARGQHAWAVLMQGDEKSAEEEGRALLAECRRVLGDRNQVTRLARSVFSGALITAGRLDEAEKVYGDMEAPANPKIVRDFQGRYEPRRHGIQLLVFWETWCPYSQRAMPELEPVYERYRRDIQVVGLTRGTRSSTDEKIRAFIANNKLSFPVVKEDGGVWDAFGVTGTPWITILRNGRVVWEKLTNTPEVIPEPMLQALARADR